MGKGTECRGFLGEEKQMERELRTEQTVRGEHAQCEEQGAQMGRDSLP